VSIRTIAKSLKNVERIFVHTISDLNELKKYGLIHNTTLFPHGVVDNSPYNQSEIKEQLGLSHKTIISSYGFLLRHKGIIQLITAFKRITEKIPNAHLFLINSLYPDEDSVALRKECKDLIVKLNLGKQITLITDFLTDNECQYLLGCSDVIVFPYQKTQESSSAAIRAGISSRRPVVCTNLEIFEDVSSIVHFLPGIGPDDIARGLIDLLERKEVLNAKIKLQDQWIKNHSWIHLTKRLEKIIRSVANENDKKIIL
jgi:glycosyltransferase involved in cell wall biosynthesis